MFWVDHSHTWTTRLSNTLVHNNVVLRRCLGCYDSDACLERKAVVSLNVVYANLTFRTTHIFQPRIYTLASRITHSRMRYALLPPANKSSGDYYSYNILILQLTNYPFQLLIMALPTTAIVASINPFPVDVRIAFQSYIQSPHYINQGRIPYQKWNRVQVTLILQF